MKKYIVVIFVFTLLFFNTGSVASNEVTNNSIDIIKRGEFLKIMLNIDFKSHLSETEISKTNKVNVKFTDINKKKLSVNELFNLKYLVYRGALDNVDKFNPNNDLNFAAYNKIMTKSFDVSADKLKQYGLSIKNKTQYASIKKQDILLMEKNTFIMNQFMDSNKELNYTYFHYLNAFYQATDNKKENITVKINNYTDMYNFLLKMENNYYYQIVMKSDTYDSKKLSELYQQVINDNKAELFKNQHTLFHYKENKINKRQFTLTDNNRAITSYIYHKSLITFTELFAENHKDLTNEEYLQAVYDYIFNHFTYNANGYDFMLVTNMGNGEMACNGISRLTYELLKDRFKIELRGGTSHFWNIVHINDHKTTLDLTTDILKGYSSTFGLSSESHNSFIKNSAINFYDAEYDLQKYEMVTENKINILNEK